MNSRHCLPSEATWAATERGWRRHRRELGAAAERGWHRHRHQPTTAGGPSSTHYDQALCVTPVWRCIQQEGGGGARSAQQLSLPRPAPPPPPHPHRRLKSANSAGALPSATTASVLCCLPAPWRRDPRAERALEGLPNPCYRSTVCTPIQLSKCASLRKLFPTSCENIQSWMEHVLPHCLQHGLLYLFARFTKLSSHRLQVNIRQLNHTKNRLYIALARPFIPLNPEQLSSTLL